MTREQRFLFKIAAMGSGYPVQTRTQAAGGGGGFRSTRLNFNTPMRDRSADAAKVISDRNKKLNNMATTQPQDLTNFARQQRAQKNPYNYAANSVFTPTKLPGGGVIYAAYNKDKVQQQINDPRWNAKDRAKAQNMLNNADKLVQNRTSTNFATQAAAGKTFSNQQQRQNFINQQKQFYRDNRDKQAVRMRGSGTTDFSGQFRNMQWDPAKQARTKSAEAVMKNMTAYADPMQRFGRDYMTSLQFGLNSPMLGHMMNRLNGVYNQPSYMQVYENNIKGAYGPTVQQQQEAQRYNNIPSRGASINSFYNWASDPSRGFDQNLVNKMTQSMTQNLYRPADWYERTMPSWQLPVFHTNEGPVNVLAPWYHGLVYQGKVYNN